MMPMVNGTFVMDEKEFANHMISKIGQWKPITKVQGPDFCVFEFDFKYKVNDAVKSLDTWQDTYNYRYVVDPDEENKRIVIINKSGVTR